MRLSPCATAKLNSTRHTVGSSSDAFTLTSPKLSMICGQTRYTLELSRLYATDEAIGDGVSFYELDDLPSSSMLLQRQWL